jgi:uncharacterized membrane protein YfcA
MTPDLVALCLLAFAAGFIDAVVGGGGLVQIPALLALRPDTDVAVLLGTNKAVGIWGTLAASLQYSRAVDFPWRAVLPMALAALAFGYLGARAVALLPSDAMRPVVLVALILVLGYTLWKKDFGRLHAPRLGPAAQIGVGLAAGAAIGFYDGFLGPGTGSFLVLAFVGLFGFNFLHASASAKVVNVLTNGAALAFFATQGLVLWSLALPMAVANVAGSLVGSRLAIRRGSGFVRVFFVIIVAALILRIGHDLLRG